MASDVKSLNARVQFGFSQQQTHTHTQQTSTAGLWFPALSLNIHSNFDTLLFHLQWAIGVPCALSLPYLRLYMYVSSFQHHRIRSCTLFVCCALNGQNAVYINEQTHSHKKRFLGILAIVYELYWLYIFLFWLHSISAIFIFIQSLSRPHLMFIPFLCPFLLQSHIHMMLLAGWLTD